MLHRAFIPGLLIGAALLGAQLASVFVVQARKAESSVKFKVRIENISDPAGQTASNGTKWLFALSPGLFVVHRRDVALFKEGQPASAGIEAQAEDGEPLRLVQMLESAGHSANWHGTYSTPVGAAEPGPIGPGSAYAFTFEAMPGMKLSIALMFGQSNDLFYANDPKGIDLFNSRGRPLAQDITDKLILWDAGTEVDQEPGIGPDQAPRQKAPNTGAAENSVVHRAKDSVFYGRNSQFFHITITPETSAGM